MGPQFADDPSYKRNKNNSQKDTHNTPRNPQVPFKIAGKTTENNPLPVLKCRSKTIDQPPKTSKIFLSRPAFQSRQTKQKQKAFYFSQINKGGYSKKGATNKRQQKVVTDKQRARPYTTEG